MDLRTYRSLLTSDGSSLAEIKKKQSYAVINNTFTQDPTYKRVYILTKDGWKFEDAKYQPHTTKSILRDDVDYFLQFRPKVHYPIGSYVIIPDDVSDEINLTEQELIDPFTQPVKNRTQWWMIVDADRANAFVRHYILPCNWEFRWMWDGRIQKCFGAIRSAQSYTSGVWRDERSSSTDNLSGAWLPDIYHVYGDNLDKLGLDDNRTIMHEQRFLFSNNTIDPKVYQVTKVVDLSPQGVIKLSLKQDEYNRMRDSIETQVCDYYTNSGENTTLDDESEETSYTGTSEIKRMLTNEDHELDEPDTNFDNVIQIGIPYYFSAIFSSPEVVSHWHVTYLDDEENKEYYEGLIKIGAVGANSVFIKTSKAKSLIGKHFVLSVSDDNGNYYSSITLEVSE